MQGNKNNDNKKKQQQKTRSKDLKCVVGRPKLKKLKNAAITGCA